MTPSVHSVVEAEEKRRIKSDARPVDRFIILFYCII
jgi:hypothetical protein